MFDEKYTQRIRALFRDLECLETNPAGAGQALRLEIDALRARLQALESEALKMKSDRPAEIAQAVATRPVSPIIYEKDRVGYAYAGNKLESIRQSELVQTRADRDVVLPLIASGETIGAIQIQSPVERSLTPEEMDLAGDVVRQVSQQIHNLRLLTATERARAEAEASTRRFVHEGWASYLDAIHQHERIGYTYDQASVTPYQERLQADAGMQEAVVVTDEQVGTLYVRPDPARPFSDDDRLMVSAVARQLAQQVENLRLLADASRARAQAEEATRQLTREGWEMFTGQQDEGALSFMYDTLQVSPFDAATLPSDVVLTEALTVRGETVGQLAVAGLNDVTPENMQLAASIAAQASIHLETLRLTQELRKRARELQELDRLKSAFLANMSHELRTPLNSILGFSDVILEEIDGPLTEPMQNDLQLIRKNGKHLLHLINDVLDMAKIEAGRLNLNPEKFVVQDILNDVLSITSTLASEKNLSIFVEADSDKDVEIFADSTRLRQVMINLVNNSIKFTDAGRIAIRTTRQGADSILIRVKDTGVGIPSDKLEAVFQEFAQVDTSSTRKAGGTGLGLPISRRLIELHGGRLWAESNGVPGEGSSFYVELPLEARMAEPIEKQEKQHVQA